MKTNLKVLGLVVSVAGAALSVASGIIGEKQTDAKIQEKVMKALAEAKDNQ